MKSIGIIGASGFLGTNFLESCNEKTQFIIFYKIKAESLGNPILKNIKVI